MKLRDKVAELSPEDIGKHHRGGIADCPENYTFLDNRYDQDDVEEICNSELPMFEKCTKCWDLDYIEDEEELAPEPVNPKPSKILDSGNRREFDSGAVRDVAEGKGRCDLLPLAEVYRFLLRQGWDLRELTFIRNFRIHSDVNCLYDAIDFMARRMNLTGIDAIIEVSKHFEDGCIKYGERNWEKGIPIHCYMDSGIRHLLKLIDGQTDERHDRAFIWNMLCAIWTMSNHPELDDFTDEGGANEL